MPFDAAMDFIDSYRSARQSALNNVSPQRWFLSSASSLKEVFDTTFASVEDNQQWSAEAETGQPNMIVCQGWRLKIAYLVGCRHDLREQFAWDKDHKIRTPVNWRCFEYMRQILCGIKAKMFRMLVNGKCGP